MTSRTNRPVLSFRTLARRHQGEQRAIRIHRPSRQGGAERRSNATDPPKAPIRPSIGSRAMCTERLFTQESSPKRERLMNWISVVRTAARSPFGRRGCKSRIASKRWGRRSSRRRGRRRGGGPRADKQKHDFSLSSICPTRVPRAAFGGGGGGGGGLREEVGGRWRDKTGRR